LLQASCKNSQGRESSSYKVYAVRREVHLLAVPTTRKVELKLTVIYLISKIIVGPIFFSLARTLPIAIVLHFTVQRPATALGNSPFDVLEGVLDVAANV